MYIISRELDINDQIRARKVRVIDPNGEQLGVLQIKDAIRKATEFNQDLVLVSPNGNPPVCRIMDYGKYKYEQSKREREARKKQHTVNLKELRMSPTIENHDMMTKVRRAITFLNEGNKVKLSVRFRGRQIVHKDLGRKVLLKMAEEIEPYGKPDSNIKMEGQYMTVMYSPLQKK